MKLVLLANHTILNKWIYMYAYGRVAQIFMQTTTLTSDIPTQ